MFDTILSQVEILCKSGSDLNPNPLTPGSDHQMHVSWGARLLRPKQKRHCVKVQPTLLNEHGRPRAKTAIPGQGGSGDIHGRLAKHANKTW